ncbi:hypothetical protein CLV28_1006 [Sediminihabitans luteus]|uniref:CopC domain-containing protein n=1 Tax=Sediminihabitans luteus TaxID=1138585 RepID=A0A2M9D0U4_9CELL|nr:copper resistance CopC family protein [Sediminihabitans luteus]PJJ77780.1 hypothetical protein CLV28_1006 [Sediminihabitans luteus]GII99862.1 hypothetical protein Slu03_22400 [Sediminihabitans luteus]
MTRQNLPARPATARRALAGLGTAALTGLLLLAVPGAAQAHDQLVGADPADGSTLTAVPDAITLTFNEEVLEVSPEIVVTDASGTAVTDGTPTVSGIDVTQALPADLANGEYDVAWRVVSGDGHPIDGELSFTVDAPAPVATQEPAATSDVATDLATDAASDGAASDDAAASEATDTAPSAQAVVTSATTDDGAPTALLIGGAAVLAAALVTVLLVVRRNRGFTGGNGPASGQA